MKNPISESCLLKLCAENISGLVNGTDAAYFDKGGMRSAIQRDISHTTSEKRR
jgi:hypothetical protein